MSFLRLAASSLLFDEHSGLYLVGLEPRTEVRLVATMVDDSDREWRSEATYLTGPDGGVRTDRDPPLGGTYFGLSPRGLLWSMQTPEEGHFERLSLEPLECSVVLEQNGQTIGQESFQRRILNPDVERLESEGGLVFRAPKSETNVLLLVEQREAFQEDGAALLASRGYTTVLYRFHTPLDLEEPLELVDRWKEKSKRLILCGCGRGGELALLLACRRPGLGGIISCSGSGLVFPGWREGGKPLAAVPVDPTQIVPREPVSTRKVYAEAVVNKKDRVRIPVEQSQADLLLLSGQDDQVWPSSAFSELANQRLRRADYPFSHKHLTYTSAGHLLGPDGGYPHRPTTRLGRRSGTARLWHALGGNPSHQAHAQRKSWEALLGFLESHKDLT